MEMSTSRRNVRSDNSVVVEDVHSINLATRGRRMGGFLESSREELELSGWLTLSHIPRTLSIVDELTKSTTRRKLISILTKIISVGD